MRIVAGFFGVLFMLAGALGMAFGLMNMPADTYATGDDWSCYAGSNNEQTCRHAGDSPQDAAVQSMWVNAGLIVGAALFVGGGALAGGAVASSGLRQVVQRAVPTPTQHVPAGPPQPPAGR